MGGLKREVVAYAPGPGTPAFLRSTTGMELPMPAPVPEPFPSVRPVRRLGVTGAPSVARSSESICAAGIVGAAVCEGGVKGVGGE